MHQKIIAIIYDFDKTLSKHNMQEDGFVSSINMDKDAFWKESNHIAKENQMDKILSCMRIMLKKSSAADQKITRETFVEFGKEIELYDGVKFWFTRIED